MNREGWEDNIKDGSYWRQKRNSIFVKLHSTKEKALNVITANNISRINYNRTSVLQYWSLGGKACKIFKAMAYGFFLDGLCF